MRRHLTRSEGVEFLTNVEIAPKTGTAVRDSSHFLFPLGCRRERGELWSAKVSMSQMSKCPKADI